MSAIASSAQAQSNVNARERKSFGAEDDVSWSTDVEDYALKSVIGKGAFAKVYHACYGKNGADVAVKVMDLEDIQSDLQEITSEVRTMKMLKNSSILPIYCSFITNQKLWLVMPLLQKGSCLRIMRYLKKAGKGDGLKEEWIATILKSVVEGLEYVHAQKQIHRDIKAGNLLMRSDGQVVLSDFGVAGWMNPKGLASRTEDRRTFVGTPCWMAPEVMEQAEGYDERADIWSLGITAMELAKGYAPYARYQPMKVLLKTIQDDPPSLKTYDDDPNANGSKAKQKFSRSFKEIIQLCLQKEADRRPSCTKLLSKPFLKKARSKDTIVKELLDAIPIPDIDKDISTDFEKEKNSDFPDPKLKVDAYVSGTTWDFCIGGSNTEEVEGGADQGASVEGAVKNEEGVFEKDGTAFIEAMMEKTGVLGEGN